MGASGVRRSSRELRRRCGLHNLRPILLELQRVVEKMSRTRPSPEIRELAQRLFAYEVAREKPAEANLPALVLAVEKLRRPLVTLAGIAGFRSLLARALTLAKEQVIGLSAVQIEADGSLEVGSDLGNHDQAAEAGVMLIAQLLGLLVTFIGESLMLRLVRDAWPDLPAVDYGSLRKVNYDPTQKSNDQ